VSGCSFRRQPQNITLEVRSRDTCVFNSLAQGPVTRGQIVAVSENLTTDLETCAPIKHKHCRPIFEGNQPTEKQRKNPRELFQEPKQGGPIIP